MLCSSSDQLLADRLLNNPYAQPPLPSDWEVHPTYPVHSVPYFLAPLWDAEYKAKAARQASAPKKPTDPRAHGSAEEQAASRIPRELREKLKKSRGAKGLLQDLEEEVRGFVEAWEAKKREMEQEGLIDEDSEDEEIVFVGRNGAMSDERRREREQEDLRRNKMVFESLVDDHGAAFGYVSCMTDFGPDRDANNCLQTLARAFDCHILWPRDLVCYYWQSAKTGGVRWPEEGVVQGWQDFSSQE